MTRLNVRLNENFSRALLHYQKVVREADPRPLPLTLIVESALLNFWMTKETRAECEAIDIAMAQPQGTHKKISSEDSPPEILAEKS